jgi:hypothetical protein
VQKQIGGGLAIEACEAQEDEHKQGRGVVGTDHSVSDDCSGSSTHSDEDHSYLPALYAARIGQRDKNFHKILCKFTKDFSGPGVGSEGPRQFQNSTSFWPFDSGSSNKLPVTAARMVKICATFTMTPCAGACSYG